MPHSVSLRSSLVVALCLAALAVLAPDRAQMALWYERVGFYGVFASFGLWAACLLRGLDKNVCREFCRTHAPAGLLALCLVVAAFWASPPKFRILFDEANLAGLAMGMYQDKSAAIPENGYFAAGNWQILSTTLDKRPLAFPLLTYLVHSLTGYRGDNGFAVNFMAGLGALLALSLLLRRWLDATSGVLGQLLLAAFPLFVLWTTSNGFEVLNLCFILLAFLALDDFLLARTARNAERCLWTLVILAQCRYESIVFLVVFVALMAWLLPRVEYKKLSVLTIAAPFVLIPLAWQQILFLRAEDHQLDAGGAIFGLGHLLANLGNALEALRGGNERYGLAAPTFFLALAGLVWAGFAALRQGWARQPRCAALLAAAGASYALISVVQLGYHLGDLTAPTTQRLAIIYLPVLVVPAVYCLYRLGRLLPWLPRYLPAACLGLLVFFWPVAGKNQAVAQLNAFRAYERGRAFLAAHYPDKNVLVVAERAHLYLIHGYSAVNFPFASDNFTQLAGLRRKGLFQEIVAIQEVRYEDNAPGKDFVLKDQSRNDARLEPLYREQLDPRKFLRIAKVLVE